MRNILIVAVLVAFCGSARASDSAVGALKGSMNVGDINVAQAAAPEKVAYTDDRMAGTMLVWRSSERPGIIVFSGAGLPTLKFTQKSSYIGVEIDNEYVDVYVRNNEYLLVSARGEKFTVPRGSLRMNTFNSALNGKIFTVFNDRGNKTFSFNGLTMQFVNYAETRFFGNLTPENIRVAVFLKVSKVLDTTVWD